MIQTDILTKTQTKTGTKKKKKDRDEDIEITLPQPSPTEQLCEWVGKSDSDNDGGIDKETDKYINKDKDIL